MNITKQRLPLPPPASRLFLCRLLLCLLLLAACNVAVTPAPPSVTPTETAPATPTLTAVPSPSATPQSPQVILLSPPGVDEALADRLEAGLAGLAEGDGLSFDTASDVRPEELKQGVKLLVALPPDPGLSELAAASPKTQFLAVGIPDVEAGKNISSVSSAEGSPDQIAFAAGYLAAAITTDWRAGILREQGTPEGDAAQLGYTNGVVYFCGLCRPVYPPFPIPGYPLSVPLADTSTESDWQSAISNFQTWNVRTVFVDPGIASEGLYRAIADAGMNIIGTGEPPAGLKDHWVASIEAGDLDEAVSSLWPDLIAGEGGIQLNQALQIKSANADLFSPGRQALVEEMLGELSQGYIDTGVSSGGG